MALELLDRNKVCIRGAPFASFLNNNLPSFTTAFSAILTFTRVLSLVFSIFYLNLPAQKAIVPYILSARIEYMLCRLQTST